MKLFISCLVSGLFYVALADVKNNDENKTAATGKSSVSKPKRDASLLSGVFHGPSYKYLPPAAISSTYDTYPGKVNSYAIYSGGHISGLGGVYRTGFNGGHGHRHAHGYPSTGNRNIAVYHSLDSEPTLSFGGSGHHGYAFPSVNHNAGQGSNHFIRSGYKGVASSHSGAKLSPSDFSGNRPNTFAFANGNSVGLNKAFGSGYQYTKGFGGSYAPGTTGFQSAEAFASSAGLGSHEEHHGDHVHNGAQEHVYVVSNIPTGLDNTYESKQTPVHQHTFPTAAGTAFNTKYYTQAAEQGPAYAAGHKGLGHFGFTANKPQVVHASVSGASFQQPSYSKAPFKPSTFLGAKFEGSAIGDLQPQQYLPPLEEPTGSTGYDYVLPTETHQEPNHHQTVEVQTTSVHEPDSAYLHPKHSPDSVYELSSGPNGNYLPPTDSYGIPYSH